MKYTAEFSIDNCNEFKIKMLNWANRFSIFCMLDNHHYQFQQPAFECLLGAGNKRNITASAGNAFNELNGFCALYDGWLFGHFGYDLKNELEKLSSSNDDGIGFPDLHFFEPEIVLQLTESNLVIHADIDTGIVFSQISSTEISSLKNQNSRVEIKNRISREDYIQTVEKLRGHILRGDCYEINFCQEFYAGNVVINPVEVYTKLSAVSPNPFSAFYKLHDKFCICASPERYLKKEGNRIISQPIKGTSRRDAINEFNDRASRLYLETSSKEKSENTMVVDLVRNDLSKICNRGTVKVKELHGIYGFPQVYQMISTVEGEVDDTVLWADIIRATFPMGSMTGAPKKKVMELIEQYEKTKRGLFSGAVGYVMPGGNFDFNVVIRSILYNNTNKYISYQAGSAITFNSNPEEEYNECLLKIAAIEKVLNEK